MMPVVYIAGPFSGQNQWEVELNIRIAEMLAFKISCLGASPLCPHTNTRFFNGTHTYEFWIAATMALLSKCDAIVMTQDWTRSSGARGEHAYAVEHGIPVFHEGTDGSIPALADWILKQ